VYQNSQSIITDRKRFFRGCKFFNLLNMNNYTTSYEWINPTEFRILSDDLFRSRVEYQLSTTSAYRKCVTALSRSITKTYYEVNNLLRVMQESSPDHIIRLEVMCRQWKIIPSIVLKRLLASYRGTILSRSSKELWCQSVLEWLRQNCIRMTCAFVLMSIKDLSFLLTLLWSFFVQTSTKDLFFTGMICLSVCILW
jgi:hypothetical protein